jgi:hypothetical protein
MVVKKVKRVATRKPKTKPIPNSQDIGMKFRVWKLDNALKEAINEKRNSRGQTVRDFVAESIGHELPSILNDLAKLGVSIEDSESITSVRFPMQESSLAALRDASRVSGLDQSQLFIACLRLAVHRKRRRGTA